MAKNQIYPIIGDKIVGDVTAADLKSLLNHWMKLDYGNYRDAKTGVPVTRLWVQQNARLQELMAEYNAKFNK